jgi:hypothetical protein
VRPLRDVPRYRERARALQEEYARHDAVALGVELLERLATTAKPVVRADQPLRAPLPDP